MNENLKRASVALAAILGFLGLSAQSCERSEVPQGTVFSVDRPPLAQSLGCGSGLWLLKVEKKTDRDNPALTPDQRAQRLAKQCLKPADAGRYTVGGQYP